MFNLLLAGETNSSSGNLILIIGLIVIVVGMLIFSTISNKKKQKEAKNMVDSLKKGDRVKTIGGICGFVEEINNEENTFVLETGSQDKKSYIKFDKGAIYQTAPAEGTIAAKKAEEKKLAEENKEEKPSKKASKKAEKKEVEEVKEEKAE